MLKLKHLFIFPYLFFVVGLNVSFSQNENTLTQYDSLLNDIPSDSSAYSLDGTDSLSIDADSLEQQKIGDIETTIQYMAEDSIHMDVPNQIINLYGEAQIIYGDIELTASHIEINYLTHLITAKGTTDSLGNEIGKPVFKDGDENFETDNMKYNFESRKAIIDGVVTQQGEAVMQGEKVFKNSRDELFISQAKYTTCNLADPHFHIQSSQLKVIPNSKVVSGPFYIKIRDIPTPLGFAFGMFPVPKQKVSGILFPGYGEEKRRGFYLKNGGYYFAISDYIDLSLTGEIYSKGSWGLNAATSYNKRYSYTGRFNARYNNQKGLSEGDSTVINDLWVNWSHSPQSKGTSRFSASVNAGTSTYNQNNPTNDLRNTLNQEFNSSVSYSKTFKGTPFSMNASSRLQQNVNTGLVNLLLPELALNMSRIYPFKFGATSAKNWIQKISFSWNMNSTNRASNNKIGQPSFPVVGYNPENDTIVPLSDLGISGLWARAENGVRHQLPISTSMNLFKFITFSPSFNYSELWYLKELNYQWIDEAAAVKVDTIDKFSRAYQYSASGSFNTRLYGTLNFRGEKIQAIRHVMIPSVSMSFSPDFSDDKYGYYQEVQIDTLGNTRKLSKYEGFVYGTPSAGENASASFSLSNNLEMKVKTKKDTTDKARKVVLLDNLSFNTSYNFLADSFQLAPIRIAARTRIFNKKLDISFNSTLDPYIYQLDSIYFTSNGDKRVAQRRRNIYTWDIGEGIGQLTQATLALGMSLNPKARDKNNQREEDLGPLTAEEEMQLEFIKNNPELYIDFDIPWDLRFNYNVNYRKRGHEDADIIQALTFSGSITFTEKWNMSFSSGFDFESLEFTQTNFNITRDLHCWQMNFSWTPFGRYQSYYLTINAKSSLLQDLKVNKQRSWFDN
ncbi:MAG: LPS-assembly protein LptD [Cyclobacteriaceae bacterium]|nr:LPS-assembly protein LptD [Cyclobacteriaceae bacterium]